MAGSAEAAASPARKRMLPSTLLWQTFLLVGLLLVVALGSWSPLLLTRCGNIGRVTRLLTCGTRTCT